MGQESNPLPPLNFSPPSFRESPPPFNPETFQPPPYFLKFWLESQTPPLERGVPTMIK